jgi:hypothetical protein
MAIYKHEPTHPSFHGLIKVHKHDKSIRPIVNWKNSPAYKLAEFLFIQIKQITLLPNTLNVTSSFQIINDLKT